MATLSLIEPALLGSPLTARTSPAHIDALARVCARAADPTGTDLQFSGAFAEASGFGIPWVTGL